MTNIFYIFTENNNDSKQVNIMDKNQNELLNLKAVQTEGLGDFASKAINNDKTLNTEKSDSESEIDEKEIMRMLETFQKTSASLPKKEYGRAYKKKRKKRVKEQKKSRRLNR